jgi:hypothetical protein
VRDGVISVDKIHWQITDASRLELVKTISSHPDHSVDVYFSNHNIIHTYLEMLDNIFNECGNDKNFRLFVQPKKMQVWKVYSSSFFNNRLSNDLNQIGDWFKLYVGSGNEKKIIACSLNKIQYYKRQLGISADFDTGVLRLGRKYTDSEWTQLFKESVSVLSVSKSIVVDLSSCEWGDPHPLLSLILQIRKWNDQGKRIRIKVRNNINRFSKFLVEQGFFPELIKAGGNSVKIINEKGEEQERETYLQKARNEKLPLRYINQTCIPVHVFNTKENEEKIADDLVRSAKKRGLLKFLTSLSDDPHFSNSIFILQELRQAISELVGNVRKHAYPENLRGYGALYARLRHGADDSLCPDKEDTKKCFSEELDQQCGFKASEVQSTGFIELFVSDIGCGFEKSLERQSEKYQHSKKESKTRRNLFHSLLSRIHNRNEPMALVGEPSRRGLSYICTMLKLRSGYIRIGSSGYWAGWDVANKKKRPHGFTSKTPKFADGAHVTVRISKWNSLKLPEKWTTESFTKQFTSELPDGETAEEKLYEYALKTSLILQSYRAHSFDDMKEISECGLIEPLNIICIDDLAVGQLINSGIEDPHTLNKTRRATLGCRTPYKIVLWRPEKNMTRQDILDHVKTIVIDYPTCSCLIIADQDLSHSLLTLSVFENIPLESVGNIDNILIMSSNYSHVELEKNLKANQMKVRTERNSLAHNVPNLNFAHVVHAYKRIDANFFHLVIVSDKSNRPYLVKGPILWSDGVELSHFIDFNATLKNELCNWIYKRSLSRFLAYCSISQRPFPTDHHVEKLIDNYNFYNNDIIFNPIDSQKIKISVILSSVVVTGKTIDSAALLRKEKDKQHFYCFFFRSARSKIEPLDSPSNFFYLLRWTSELESYIAERGQWTSPRIGGQEVNKYTHRRITDSPSIGKIGNKEWHFIRAYPTDFPKPKNLTSNQANTLPCKKEHFYIYGNSPHRPLGIGPGEVYEYWQEQDCVKFGHWSAGGHHDCIGVRTLDPVQRDSVDPVGKSWQYIRSHLDRVFLSKRKINVFEKCDLLVCVSGEVSQFLISEIRTNDLYQKESIVTDVDVNDRICVLSTVKGYRSATRLRFNPLDLDELKQKILTVLAKDSSFSSEAKAIFNPASKSLSRLRRVKILLFVPTITSIRSLLEMREAIVSVSPDHIDKIRTFSLLDRSRMPNTLEQVIGDLKTVDHNGSLYWHAKHSRLWRLDIDCLAAASQGVSHSQGCPLCMARQTVERLQKNVDNSMVWERLDEICKDLLPRRINGYRMEQKELRFDLSAIVNTEPKIILHRYNREDPNPLTEPISIKTTAAIACLLVELVTVSGDYLLVEKWLKKLDTQLKIEELDDVRRRLIQAKIEIIVSVVLYFRMDMDDNRRFYFLANLLRAMYEAKESSRITAFGLGAISIADIDMATRLVKYLCENQRIRDTGDVKDCISVEEKPLIERISNMDFHLANSILLGRCDRDEVFGSKKSKTMLPRLRSESNLLSEKQHSFTSQLISIFGELGYRGGDRHKTYLEDYLKGFGLVGIQDKNIPQRIRASVIKVINALDKLKDMPADLIKTFDFNKLTDFISQTQVALSLDSSIACWKSLYQKREGLLSFLKSELLFDYEKMYDIWNEMVSSDENPPHYICEIHGNMEDVHDIQSFYTGNTHELVREYILNAKKHFEHEKDLNITDHWIHFIVSVDNESREKSWQRVQITIRNSFYLSEPSKRYKETVNVAVLQQQGGGIKNPSWKANQAYEVTLYLPTLNTMYERGAV